MNAQQLRNSILQEAIEGRLVPQDPNDEPASVLLDKIRKEKAKLVKEGKLKKKDLEETPISEDEKPFEIPESWEWVRLSQISEIQSSKRVYERDYVSFGIPFYRSKEIGDLSRGENIHTELYITKNHYNELKEKYGVPQIGDILITSVGSIGNFWICDGREFYYKDGNVTQICANPSFDSKYISFFLSSQLFSAQTKSSVSGTAYNALTIIKLKSIILPLPPLAEQKRIVAKIEELLPKVEEYGKAQEALNKLNEELPEKLKKSILQEAIEGRLVPQDPNDEPASVLLDKIRAEKKQLVKEGKLKKKDLEETPISEDEKPFEIPDSWEWVRIPDIGISQLGKAKNPHHLSGQSLPYLCSINVYWEGINLSQTKEMLFEESEIDKYTIRKGDLLICEGGDCGRSAIWDKEKTIVYQNALHRVRFFCNIDSKYILYCLYLYKTSNQLDDYIKGETIKHLVKGELDSILFPLPPLAEQKRIVAKIEEVFKEIDKLKA